MTKMAQAFNTTVAALEDELTQLILEGLINARIDSHSKVRSLPLSLTTISLLIVILFALFLDCSRTYSFLFMWREC